MSKYFAGNFKMEAVKRVERTGETVAMVWLRNLESMSTLSIAGYSVIVSSRSASFGGAEV